MDKFRFKFSIITAVYNVEEFLSEAIDSVIGQDIGFRENVQLVLVDDGSTDASRLICDDYAKRYLDNIVVVHKKNEGVASARNAGLKFAEGQYINFMDSDDKFSRNVLSKVYEFFSNHENDVDVVTIPMKFFEVQSGDHWLNYKFKRGNRVIDLYREYDATLMSVSASFISYRCKEEIVFDDKLAVGEDIKVLLSLLYKKMKFGVVTSCKYLYRKRCRGEPSLTDECINKYGWYFDYFDRLINWSVNFYKEKLGFVPAYVQYLIASDLKWRIKTRGLDGSKKLREEDRRRYRKILFESFKSVDDSYILEQREINFEHKNFILSEKYNRLPQITECDGDAIMHFGERIICRLSECPVIVEFLDYKENVLSIEGFSKFFGDEFSEGISSFVLFNGKKIQCEPIQRENFNDTRFGREIATRIGFKCRIPLDGITEYGEIKFGMIFHGLEVVKKKIGCGKFFPIIKEFNNSYYSINGLLVTAMGSRLLVYKCKNFEVLKREVLLLWELWTSKGKSARKAVVSRCLYHMIKPFCRKKIWLISDRVNKADDNGEALFCYINKKNFPVNSYFVIRKDSADYPGVKNQGKVLDHLSWKHKVIHLLADNIISSAGDEYVYNPFGENGKYYRDILYGQKRMFLQHGITKDDFSGVMNRYRKDFSLFITAAIPEYDSIINGKYSYGKDVVKLTGFARFDRLEDKRKRVISIMPTWRSYLSNNSTYVVDGVKRYNNEFRESEYFNFYNKLLNDDRLIEAIRIHDYEIKFMPHPNVISYIKLFTKNTAVTFCSVKDKYRNIFRDSSLVVTDYSSIAFDFAYLRKPVIYCQFDSKTFFKEQLYDKGYFDYEKDGFGEVEKNLEDTVSRIIEYLENGCLLKDKYKERIERFYAFNDRNNCQRIYEVISEI